MYEIFKSVITSKSYNLEQMIKKINTRWVEDTLTEEQREELIALAQTNADPSQSNAPLQKQIEEISKKQIALEDTVEKLSATVQKIKETVESGGTVVPDPEPPVTEKNIQHGSRTMVSHQYHIRSDPKLPTMAKSGNPWFRTMFGNPVYLG